MKRIMFICVVAVLGLAGAAYGASKVTGAQIKDGTITAKDLKNRSITTSKLATRTLEDLQGSPGDTGPAGPAGPAGPQGPAGPTVVGKLTPVGARKTIAAGTVDSVTVACPAGMRVISGGFMSLGGAVWSSKTYDGVSWTASIDNYEWSIATDAEVYAQCAPAGAAVAASVKSASARNSQIERDEAERRAARK